jgi:hypothetical protein
MTRSPDTAIVTLGRRFKARLEFGLSLVRVYRFVAQLEPAPGEEEDPAVALAKGFRTWRLALLEHDTESALDSMERVWTLLDACRLRVASYDAVIAAYRVRWACENAPLGNHTISALARFYRVMPVSTSSQSKYEYALTRLLAGPIGPDRRLASTEELEDAVMALEGAWGATPLGFSQGDVSAVKSALEAFAAEAGRHADAASFTSSALLRRFGAFKASIGAHLFDPRISVAVVETNVAVLNVLNQLLADAGGAPLKGRLGSKRAKLRARTAKATPPVPAVEPPKEPTDTLALARPEWASSVAADRDIGTKASPLPEDTPAEVPANEHEPAEARAATITALDTTDSAASVGAAPAPEAAAPETSEGETGPQETLPEVESPHVPVRAPRPDLQTGEIDLSSLEFARPGRASDVQADPPPVEWPDAAPVPASPSHESPLETLAASTEGVADPAPIAPRPDLRTGEVDLSGLEFVRRLRRHQAPPLPGDPDEEGEEGLEDEEPDQTRRPETGEWSDDPLAHLTDAILRPSPPPGADRGVSARSSDAEQQPSARAFELAKSEENAVIVERYLTPPRSPEVWQLDLDVFLSPSPNGAANSASGQDRRRALELILSADDLICARAQDDEAPSAEYRAELRTVATAMLMLRTTLRRAAEPGQGDARELEPIVYAADHLLWERLRLEASLKRKPSRQRLPVLPQVSPLAAVVVAKEVRGELLERHRRILGGIVAAAFVLTMLVGVLGFTFPRPLLDPEVRVVKLEGLPGAELFDDARVYKSTLFITAGRTWSLLSREERRSIIRGLGAYAAERGLDTVSVVGSEGEPSATFKDDEVIFEGDLSRADLARR